MRFCFLLPALTLLCSFVEGLNIASFNIQIFGTTKYGKKDVVEVLVRIVRRYDLVLIQEIRDASNTVIHNFLQDVNKAEGRTAYKVSVSERLGSGSHKEQYAYMYRVDRVKIADVFVISGYHNTIERPPYVALIHPIENGVTHSPFISIGIHTRPSDAVSEINALVGVYEKATRHFNTKVALLMGDFNAACGSVSNKKFDLLTLTKDKRFMWLINEASNVATGSNCAYDRFVAAGGFEKFVTKKASVFRFDTEYGLDRTLTGKVSDHYPIQIEVVLPQQSGFSTTTIAVGVTVAAGAAIIGVRAFQRRRAPTTN
jgi:endonuclease/exonuclease/phosphatase family metal-dependent hydrolase